MNADSTCKYAGAALIMASLLALVVIGKMDASLYVSVAIAALSGLGIHAATRNAGNPIADDPTAPIAPPQPPQQQPGATP